MPCDPDGAYEVPVRLPELRLPDMRLSGLRTVVDGLLTPTLRLGVTGLARAGKTVLITALVRALTEGGAAPPLARIAGIPGLRAYLEPQPDDDVPRFAYEDHLAQLAADPPRWPDSTRRISQLRLTLEWEAQDLARRSMGMPQRLHVDIVDYPGEWLIDLSLTGQTFAHWSREAMAAARQPRRAGVARAWLGWLDALDPGGRGLAAAPLDEAKVIEGARVFTAYLAAARQAEPALAILGPGRFLMPGDLEGSPLLTFFPLEIETPAPAGSLAGLLERRFESYKAKVVVPFFRDHFARLDRQIVLIDVMAALDGGPDALGDLEHALEGILATFRPGRGSWLSLVLGKRIERILFAATKADHLNRAGHARLEAILGKAVARAASRADDAGARIAHLALAGLRATEDVEKVQGGERLPLIRGVPLAGETIDGKRYDGRTPAAIFPGELPLDPLEAFDRAAAVPGLHRFVRFAPPRVPHRAGPPAPWPHVGVDRAIDFLLGDHLP